MSASGTRAGEPRIKPRTYGYSGCPLWVFPLDLLLGPAPRPFALATRRSLEVTTTTVGYHSVGMKPEAWCPVRSNTETESEIAFAEKRVFSSGESASDCGSLPP